ncbi:hypothetical protein [Longimicrobium sp.]|uniref:hypothetical protein n=1 Tax=Longimicrobium sp. TaxID=2029185 RepID=UPI002E34793D|nr:hypothetical protein [Longimicrobium sp.]HEX6036512.1 hypothetical protein [Longimicrobium sp.]
MSIQNYYRWALLLPFAVPGVLSLLALVPEPRIPQPVGALLMFLFYSVLIGGIPYVLFALGFLVWSWGRDARSVRTAIYVSPLTYAGVLSACVLGYAAWDGDLTHQGTGGTLLLLATCAFVFGYAYVALAELLRVWLGARVADPDAVAS